MGIYQDAKSARNGDLTARRSWSGSQAIASLIRVKGVIKIMATTKDRLEKLHKRLDELPESELSAVERFLDFVYYEATDLDNEELTPEDMEAIGRGEEDMKAGRYVTLEEYDQGKRP